jgi:hypothetical protein
MVRIAYVFILPNAGGKNYPVLAVVLKKNCFGKNKSVYIINITSNRFMPALIRRLTNTLTRGFNPVPISC